MEQRIAEIEAGLWGSRSTKGLAQRVETLETTVGQMSALETSVRTIVVTIKWLISILAALLVFVQSKDLAKLLVAVVKVSG